MQRSFSCKEVFNLREYTICGLDSLCYTCHTNPFRIDPFCYLRYSYILTIQCACKVFKSNIFSEWHFNISWSHTTFKQIPDITSVPCFEFMGDKPLSFLVDCNVEQLELIVKLWFTIQLSQLFCSSSPSPYYLKHLEPNL